MGENCSMIEGCLFFNDENRNDVVSEIVKTRFCHSGGFECARREVAKHAGREAVPRELFPNDMSGALRLLGNRH